MPRFNRLLDILQEILRTEGEGITILNLSRAVGLKRSPYLMGFIKQLEDSYLIAHYTGYTRNGLAVRRYYVPENKITDAYDFIARLIAEVEEKGGYYNA